MKPPGLMTVSYQVSDIFETPALPHLASNRFAQPNGIFGLLKDAEMSLIAEGDSMEAINDPKHPHNPRFITKKIPDKCQAAVFEPVLEVTTTVSERGQVAEAEVRLIEALSTMSVERDQAVIGRQQAEARNKQMLLNEIIIRMGESAIKEELGFQIIIRSFKAMCELDAT